ncbi:IclR family transcriptional regulator [Halalkalibacter oceani]|uniref:IclR family transcriptional regulator n=1 Tax=Halalkalibacter oceani TaxID=1653776 RepID=A0A9X2IN79_9BACI|nr:IclR family transcriptional regulator [Halalkalibacter oceani]MCM3713825.1 IclR family transcriptional regulator [Halalkalibacter oceani]
MAEYSSLAAVERTFVIIKTLVGKVNGLSVSKLVEETGISKSIVSRILKTLKDNHYVEQDPDTRFYRLSYDFIGLSLKHFNALGIDGLFLPALRTISAEVKELVQLSVVSQEKVYFVQKIEGDNQLKVADMLGKEAPLHCSAAGKMWLSTLPQEEIIRLVSQHGMSRYTENTITDLNELLKELEKIKQLDYALSLEEFNHGITGVAVPVYSNAKERQLMASIVITAPTVRMSEQKIKQIVQTCNASIGPLKDQLPTIE